MAEVKSREKLFRDGVATLTEKELFMLILGNGSKEKSVVKLAEAVLSCLQQQFKTFSTQSSHSEQALKGSTYSSSHPPLGSVDTTVIPTLLPQVQEALMQIPGMGVAQTARVVASLELGYRLFATKPLITILQPQDTLPHLGFLLKKQTEYCVALYLSARHELLHLAVIGKGSVNAVTTNPKDVFAPALHLPCQSIIVAHNHPSGNPEPSQEDIYVTEQIKAAGEILGISLEDHLIISKNGWFSFAERGLL